MKMFRRILHPTDFSRASGAAFARAVALAQEQRAELLLVHVLVPPTPFIGDGYVSPSTYEQLEAAARGSAERQLARVLAKARKARVPVSALLLEGGVESGVRARERPA
jgi:nucleotide-binding universal stress UspA family protein